MKAAARFIVTLTALLCGAATVYGYAFLGSRWPAGQIRMDLQLGSSGALADGSSSWNQVFEGALGTWNIYLPSTIQFTVVRESTAPIADRNGINNVFFSGSDYGRSFGVALAITTNWTVGTTRTEGDVVFNMGYRWNSYRGPLDSGTVTGRVYDLRRVALHESGHVLGLDHPDEHGQVVVAQMNHSTGDLDSLANDDILGAQALYSSSLPPTPPAATTPPGPPGGLTASASGSSVFLSWSGPSTGGIAATYVIEAGSSAGSANLANFSTGNSATTYSTTGVGAAVYYVRVRASNSAGTSAASNEALLIVGGGCTGPPASPGGLRLVSNAGGTVVLAWNAPAGVPTTYIVEAGSSPGGANLVNSDLGGPSTSLTAVSVGRGTYYVRMRAKNACGAGSASNEIVIIVS